MGSFGVETGRALRTVRRSRGLTLRELPDASGGGFKPSAVAAYERGDRTISLERFCALCRVYEVDPVRLLADILRELEGRRPVVIDIARLEELPRPDRDLVRRFVGQVRALRGQLAGEAITIRVGDLEVLATTAGRRGDELLELLDLLADDGPRRPAPTPSAGGS